MKIIKRQKNNGFTLIELMVATTIFISIMLVSMGSLFVTLDSARSSRALRFAMDNVNFAMESMTRSIRMGTNYVCVNEGVSIIMVNNNDQTLDCGSGGKFIAFMPQNSTPLIPNNNRVGYQSVDRGNGTKSLVRYEGSTPVDIVSPDVNVETLNFVVVGSSPSDNLQASVYITMKGTVIIKGIETSFAIQTLASQRNF